MYTSSFYAQSPDFLKPGLCYFPKVFVPLGIKKKSHYDKDTLSFFTYTRKMILFPSKNR